MMIVGEKEKLEPGRRALGKRRWIERRSAQNRPITGMRDCGFGSGKTKRRNGRSVGVLSNRQDRAIALLRRFLITTSIMAMFGAIGMFMRLDASGVMLGGSGKLLENVVDAMRRRGDQEEQEREGCACIPPAPRARALSVAFHDSLLSYWDAGVSASSECYLTVNSTLSIASSSLT